MASHPHSKLKSLLFSWPMTGKFNITRPENLAWLFFTGMFTRGLLIGPARVVADSPEINYTDATPEEKKKTFLERIFIELMGTLIAGYVGLQFGQDLTGKVLEQVYGHKINPAVLLKNATQQAQLNVGDQRLLALALAKDFGHAEQWPKAFKTAVEQASQAYRANTLNPQAFDEQVAQLFAQHKVSPPNLEQAENVFFHKIYGKGKIHNLVSTLNKPELLALNEATGQLSGKILPALNQHYKRLNHGSVLIILTGAVLSSVLSGAPVQYLNDTVYRSKIIPCILGVWKTKPQKDKPLTRTPEVVPPAQGLNVLEGAATPPPTVEETMPILPANAPRLAALQPALGYQHPWQSAPPLSRPSTKGGLGV